MIRKKLDTDRSASLEHELQDLHLRFIMAFQRQNDLAHSPLRSLTEDPEANVTFQGLSQALIALFFALGKTADDERRGRNPARRHPISIPKDETMRRPFAELADILRGASAILDRLVKGPDDERNDPAAVSGKRPVRPAVSDVRGISRLNQSAIGSENLPTIKDGGSERRISQSPDETGSEYRIVSQQTKRRKPG